MSMSDELVSYKQKDLVQPAFLEAVEEARVLWAGRIEAFVREHGDQGTCVLGAGIAVYVGVGKRMRGRIVLQPPTGKQGASVWEESVNDVVAFLAAKGISAYYSAGRMD